MNRHDELIVTALVAGFSSSSSQPDRSSELTTPTRSPWLPESSVIITHEAARVDVLAQPLIRWGPQLWDWLPDHRGVS
jgi:hypothetical protein